MVLRTKEDFLRKAADYAADGGKCAAYIRNNEIKGYAFYYKTETELTCVEAVADEKCYPMLMEGAAQGSRWSGIFCKAAA